MPLTSPKEMFAAAYAGGYAVGAFNVNNMEIIQGIMGAAASEKSPVILQVSAGARKYAGQVYIMKLVEAALQEDPSIPVVVHLDHGPSFEMCRDCIDGGFTSVMIDGSHLPYEENIAITKQVVDYAHPRGVWVEAELGKLAGIEEHVSSAEHVYTDPDEAEEFVARTGCGSLAVGVGTAHGVYKGTPHIEQGVLKEIRSRLEIPLVLHGTSGVPDDQVAEAIRNGICKVNYATELRQAFTKGFMGYMAANPDCFDPKKPSKPGMQEIYDVVASHMDNLGSTNKA